MEALIKKRREEFADIERKLQDPECARDIKVMAQLQRRHAELSSLLENVARLDEIQAQLRDNAALLSGDDAELAQLAAEENIALSREEEALARAIEQALVPKDPDDDKDAIVEIRAGAGGDEAALFAADMFRMYTRYAATQQWDVTVLNSHATDGGGYKEIIFQLTARGGAAHSVYGSMKYESGVHRVQRIPETEKQGRVHTSTVTVAVLPEAEEVDVQIDPKDLRIDTFASSGPGGQSVNTTMSAVRITHLPTGIVVSCQDEKSQHKNKDRAMSVLRARIKQAEEEKRAKEVGDARRAQIGSGDRSEKIRTYNYPQDRITDHRVKKNWSNLPAILDGALDDIVQTLRAADAQARTAAAMDAARNDA